MMGEYLIGSASQHIGLAALKNASHDLHHVTIKKRHQPTAMLEPTTTILIGAPRCLHDAIKAQECRDREFSHCLTPH